MNRHAPLKRSGFPRQLRATAPAKAEAKVLKPKPCVAWLGGCGEKFTPARLLQKACSPLCASNMVANLRTKDAQKAIAMEKRATRKAKEALKTIPQLKKEAQHAFNRAIRARDRLSGVACICCGRPLRWDILGGAVDAGHYRSTGSADHMRFNEDNCHAQLSECNRYGAGRAVDYRVGLISRIGLERVEALESNNTPVKWTRDGLREIRDTYRRRAREIERSQG